MRAGIIASARRRSDAGLAESSSWRLLLEAREDTGAMGLGEMELRATASGPDLCSGGTPIASGTNAGSPANVFANDGGTGFWVALSTASRWIGYQFVSPQKIEEIALTSRNDAFFCIETPVQASVQYLSGATWITYWSFLTAPWSGNETRVFNRLDAPMPAKRAWRVRVTATHGNAVWSCSDLQFRASAGGPDLAPAGKGSSGSLPNSSFPAPNAFDASLSTFAIQALNSPTFVGSWLGADLGTPQEIVEISFRNRGDGFTNESPRSFDVQYKAADGTWVTSWSVVDTPAWAVGETRVFTKP